MAKNNNIFWLIVLVFYTRKVWSASTPNVCDLPHGCRIDSFHNLDDLYAREFLSRSSKNAFICESSKNGLFRSQFSTRLAEVHLNASCFNKTKVYSVFDLKFRRDLRSRLDENSNLQGIIDYIFRRNSAFSLYLRNLGGFSVDLGLRQNFTTFNNTPVKFFQIISINTVFDFYKTNNSKRIDTCVDMKFENGSTLNPNSIFQMAPKNEYSTLFFLNSKFR